MPSLSITQVGNTKKTISGLEELSRKGVVAHEDISGSVQTIAELALKTIKRATPGSGKIRALWTLEKKRKAKAVEWLIFNKGRFTRDRQGRTVLDFLEKGTRPHIILPKTALALRFLIDNTVIFAKIIRHPGTPPFAMVSKGEKVVLDAVNRLARNIQTRVQKVIG